MYILKIILFWIIMMIADKSKKDEKLKTLKIFYIFNC